MSVKETPLAEVKRVHGNKEKLVEAVVDLIGKDSSDESPNELKVRLAAVSNKKLLRLHASLVEIKDKYGSKDRLIEALTQAQGKVKDNDYASKLHSYSIHRLIDLMNSASKKSRRPGRANS